MKPFISAYFVLGLVLTAAANPPSGEPVSLGRSSSPLTSEERALGFDPRFRHAEDGVGRLEVDGEPLTIERLRVLSPWDLMEVVQRISGVALPLSRFGQGNGDELTQAWRQRLVEFAEGTPGGVHHEESDADDPFDPALVLWDPGFIQTKNAWGQWSIRLANRDIVQSDLATLSPLEVQQAVAVLTGRTYSVEYVLEHLEAFRAQLSIEPRVATPREVHH